MRPYLAARQSVGERPEEAVQYYSAVPQDYLASRPENVLYGGRIAATNNEERHLFPGLMILLCAAVAFWPPVSRTAVMHMTAAAVAFEASLGLNGYTFRWLREWLLPFQGIRVPARYGIFVALLLAVVAGCGVAKIAQRLGRWGESRWRAR